MSRVKRTAAKRIVTIPRNTPVITTHNSRESATAATTLSRLNARSASSTATTTLQNPRSDRRAGCPAARAAAARSEERRVGKEWRARWAGEAERKNARGRRRGEGQG